MMKLKVFTQPSCPKCPAAKALIKELDVKDIHVEHYDIKTENGLAEALSYDIMSTPSIVIENNNKVIAEWRAEVPSLEAVQKVLKKA
jgi:glutaredoxin